MGDDIKLDIPVFINEPQQHLQSIKWCEGHWTELMKALYAHGLEDRISASAEELTAKFLREEIDPCGTGLSGKALGVLSKTSAGFLKLCGLRHGITPF